MKKQEWDGKTGGTHGMQRALVWLTRSIGLWPVYGIIVFVMIWYLLVRPSVTRVTYNFHRRRGRNRVQAAWDVYRSLFHFGKVIIDRFAVYGGHRFEIVVDNAERYYDKLSSKEGFVLLFSHLGNSEMGAYAMATPEKHMNILFYGGETSLVMEERAKVLAKNNIGMIVVHPGEMSHVYAINEALSRGEVLTVAGDRRMGEKTITCDFMGAKAPFPAGVFQLCATLRCPILLTFVIKETNNRYHIYTEEIEQGKGLRRSEQAAYIAQQYATRLEQMAKAYPYEWFNFFDFWQETKA